MDTTIIKKKILRFFLILDVAMLIFAAAAGVFFHNPRTKMFMSTVWFSAFTINSPEYIAHQVDLMDLCQNYINDDTRLKGTLLLNHVKDVGFSMHIDMDEKRSFAQKKMAGKASLSVLSIPIGDSYFYEENEMVYFVAPDLKDLSYAFDTEMNLFFKAPELTSDLSAEWFKAHMDDFRTLTAEIGIEETGDVIDDGGLLGQSKGYRVTIPKGSGGFLWELLGMEAPDHDIVVIMYLSPIGQTRRIYADLTEQMRDKTITNADVTIDGENLSTVIMNIGLVDDEKVVLTAVRNGQYSFTNYVNTDAYYYTDTKDVYRATGFLTWNDIANGADLKANDYIIYKNDEVVAEAYFEGALTKEKIQRDVFGDTPVDLHSIDIIEWHELKRDMDSFIKDVEKEVKERM